jgi:hypothetical protein
MWPAVKLNDGVIGLDFHTVVVPPAPPIPLMPHPYFGPIFLWSSPTFPKADVFINMMPACTVGAMGYSVHIPMGAPVGPSCTNTPYWKRYLMNVAMGLVLITLTTLANIAIAGIARFMPRSKSGSAEKFIKDVTGIDSTNTATFWKTVKESFSAFTKWPTWAKLLIPPLPYPGAQGSTAVGSPNVTVNGGPLAFVAPLVATSCSEIPVVPNAMTLGFSNVLVGVSFSDLIRGIVVSTAKAAIGYGAGRVAARLPGLRAKG